MFEKIFRTFFLIAIMFCGANDNSALSNQNPIVEDNLESLEVNSTTTTSLSTNEPEFTHRWGIQFTDQNIKMKFNEFFDLKVRDASVISEEIFYESAGFELNNCIENFEDDFINENWSEEYEVATTEEWCQRTVVLETEKTFEYPVVKENVSINCKAEFNSYMDTFIETYIREDTFERTWNNNSFFWGSTEVFGIGIENNNVTYLSFLFDVFPAGEGAYLFNDWFEINYNFKTCSPIIFEEIIKVPDDYKTIFPNLEQYTFEVTESTLIAHTFDLKICGESNLFCKPFLYNDEFKYYSYTLDFLINERGLIVNLGNYFVHRGPNYRFLRWDEIELISTEYVINTVYTS